MPYSFDESEPCGCSMNGRCDVHKAMMHVVHEKGWGSLDSGLFKAVWALSDGYGEPGTIPVQGYDWSGIRDSSIEAVEAMYRCVINWGRK